MENSQHLTQSSADSITKYNLGIKEKLRYKDIEWLMPSIDVRSVIERLGMEVDNEGNDQFWTYCPDHKIYTMREPSHPKWACNYKSGQTFCFTEGRGSNLLWTVSRVLSIHPKEAIQWMTGIDSDDAVEKLRLSGITNRICKLKKDNIEETKSVKNLHSINQDLKYRSMLKSGYQFFLRPTGKVATNINQQTVDDFQVFQRTWGYYSDRVVIPFFQKKELVGFCAVDILGEDEWMKVNPDSVEKGYRKTLYPSGFASSHCLFNYDNIEVGCDFVILTEGAREVMKLSQEGFPNSVAILGSYLSDYQIRLLTELAPKRLVLMFDGDDGGYEATRKSKKKLDRLFEVDEIILPRGMDPKQLDFTKINEYLKKFESSN